MEVGWQGRIRFVLCTNPWIAEHVYKMDRAEENGIITSSKNRIIFVHEVIFLPFQYFTSGLGSGEEMKMSF